MGFAGISLHEMAELREAAPHFVTKWFISSFAGAFPSSDESPEATRGRHAVRAVKLSVAGKVEG